MNNSNDLKALTIAAQKPDVNALAKAYENSLNDLNGYFTLCRDSYDNRRNFWVGKSKDQRKNGADAFPWKGASDIEAHVINERLQHLVSNFINALERANIRALPTNARNVPRAKIVSNFLKWMSTSGYIPRFIREMELAANYFLERGIMISYVGWNREDRTFKQKLSLEQIEQASPGVAELIQTGQDEKVTAMLMQAYSGVTDRRAKKALQELRDTGFAELPVVRRQVDEPLVRTLMPDGDWIFPAWITDPQKAPYAFWREYMTPQQLEGKVKTDGWDRGFVDYVIKHNRGTIRETAERRQEGRRTTILTDDSYQTEDLIEIIYGYQRLIDPQDKSEGIYCTVFHRDLRKEKAGNIQPYAKFELLNGYENYPVIVTRLSENNKRLYDAMTYADILKGLQNQIKVERDSRIDANSMSTLPPIMHPVGNAPKDWGPGRKVPYRRKGEFEFGPHPEFNAGSVEMEQTLLNQADRLVGLDEESQLSAQLRQFLINKFLNHCAEVLKLAYRCYLRFGPDEVFFQVTGVADPQSFQKADPDENYYVSIKYDVQDQDPESYDRKLERIAQVTSLDRHGKIDMDALLTYFISSIDPIMADIVLQPSEEARDKMIKDITDDLAKIHAGIEVPARPTGAQVALQIIQEYTKQPDIASELQSNEMFAKRLEKYAQQYIFTIQQQQNAEIGKYGTAPASVGKVDTQDMAAS